MIDEREGWNRLVREAMCDDGDTNFKFPFKVLTSRYGRAYMDYLRAAYRAKDELSDEEFCRLNHCPPLFLAKVLSSGTVAAWERPLGTTNWVPVDDRYLNEGGAR